MIRDTEPNMSKYLHRKAIALGLPLSGTFELTPRCNFNCKMCYVHLSPEDANARGKELSAEEWLNIAREAKKEGMLFLLLTGGEPLLRKDFLYIYSELKKMGFYISINTNGSLIKGEILEHFKKDPPYRVNVSLYGGSGDTYKKLCGNPAFEDVINGIREVKKAGSGVRVNLSITPGNCGDISKIYDITEELQVFVKPTAYMYPPLRIDGRVGENSGRFTPEEAAKYSVICDKRRFMKEEFLLRAQHMKDGIKVVEEDDGCDGNTSEHISCRAGRSSFWITWDGFMMPCGMMTEPKANLKTVGFKAAWDETRTKTGEILLPKECSSCKYRGRCAVCAAICLSETGKFDGKPEYLCKMIEETCRLTEEERRTLSED